MLHARVKLSSPESLQRGRRRKETLPDLTIEADYEAMKQVVFNLLLQRTRGYPAAGEVTCRVAQSGFELAITVEDRGPGLPASAADCLRPFFTNQEDGTGLGLGRVPKDRARPRRLRRS